MGYAIQIRYPKSKNQLFILHFFLDAFSIIQEGSIQDSNDILHEDAYGKYLQDDAPLKNPPPSKDPKQSNKRDIGKNDVVNKLCDNGLKDIPHPQKSFFGPRFDKLE